MKGDKNSRSCQTEQKKKGITFHVSPNGNNFWSGMFSAPNQNNTDGPFATIEKAKDTIRNLKKQKGFTSPVTVYIRTGCYQLTEPLSFTPEDSGTAECPITYAAYPEENPVVSAGKKIAHWEKGDNNLWTAEIPEVKEGKWYFRQLFANGKRRYRARLPKKGFYRVAGLAGVETDAPVDTPSRRFQFAAGNLKSNWTNLNDVEIVVLHFWVDTHLPIATVDEKIGTVTFIRSSQRKLTDNHRKEGARYYVDNLLEGLTVPGEWYLNRKTGVLYYLPKPGEKPNQMEIIAPQLDYLVRFEGEPENGRFVEYINFCGLTFSYNNWELPADDAGDYQAAVTVPGAIYGRGMCNCMIEECAVKNIGTYGIELTEGCHNNRIAHNEISEAGGGGIKVSGGDAQSPLCCRTDTTEIIYNHFHNLGQIYHSAVGILIRHSAANNISHNHIHHLYYTGISVGWVWGYEESVSKDNRIEFNHIHHIGQGLLSDMGGIYTLGVSPGTVIRNNLIYNVEAHGYGGWAIYPDEGSSHIIIENNICYDTSHTVFHQHYGRENIVRNNIFAFGRQGQVAYSRNENHIGFTCERNIVITDNQPFFLGIDIYELKERKIISDLNLFWDISKKEPIFAKSGKKTVKLSAWRKAGYDLHSVVGDPSCKNYRKLDFIPKKISPAHKLGFQSARVFTEFVQALNVSRYLDPPAEWRALPYPEKKENLKLHKREFPASFCSLHEELSALAPKDALVFLVCNLRCGEQMKLSAHLGYDGPVKVWIDGKERFCDPEGTNPAGPFDAAVSFEATPGAHEVMVALGSNCGKTWGIYLRFERLDIPRRILAKGPDYYRLPTVTV